MRQLLMVVLACLLSVAMVGVIGSCFPVPETDLFIASLIQRKLDRAAAIGNQPKLVIFAGSNGLFSHRCQVMEPMLAMPCVNASIAVGVGLDYQFARWRPMLHPGDVVYMPMEPVQFARTRAINRIGPENRLLLHEQWPVLAQLPLDRQLAVLLGVDIPTALRNLLTEPSLTLKRDHIAKSLDRDFNAWGDRVGHDRNNKEAAGAQGRLDNEHDQEPKAEIIRDGYGAMLIAGFVRWATAHGVTVVGGLHTSFDDIPMPDATIASMRQVFESNGGQFMVLPNHSRYPRHNFFDTRYHLYEGCQIQHSARTAKMLAGILGRIAASEPSWAVETECGVTKEP